MLENQPVFISYIRVSTDKQGESRLGLQAQQQAVQTYLESTAGRLIGEYVEVESGEKSKRRELEKALRQCKKEKAILVIAKLDRLARRVHFISGLMDSGVEFRAADMPHADRFMLHVYAAMAEEEGRRISLRTQDALRAAKKRGTVLGKAGKQLAARNKHDANEFAKLIGPRIEELFQLGLSTRQVCQRLNSDKLPSYRGGTWHPTTVHRLRQRYTSLP